MTPEERAEISRKNGSKSKGPTTPAGKSRSSANAVKTGEHAKQLTHFLPPHDAVLCNEDPAQFVALLRDNIDQYCPVNTLAISVVRQITIAQWDIARLNTIYTVQWNLALIEHGQIPNGLPPEFCEIAAMNSAATQLLGGQRASAVTIQRQIAARIREITSLTRQLTQIHKLFPTECRREILKRCQPQEAPKTEERTQPEDAQPVHLEPFPEPPLYITENEPEVIQAYKHHYPNRKIIILPPDDVAKGINIEDGLPPAPRNGNQTQQKE